MAVFVVLILIFASLGICDIIHAVKSALLFPDEKPVCYCVINLKSGCALQQLKFLSERKRWYGSEFCDKIFAIGDSLDILEKSYCENFTYGSDIYVCDSDSLSGFINGIEFEEVNGKENIG